MKRVMFKKINKENGQAMVEFALVLPILVLFIAGIIDFGWIFHNQLAANNASREAARYIAIHYYFDHMDAVSAKNKAKDIIVDYVSTINVTDVSVVNAPDDINGGEKVKVKLTGTVRVLTPILSNILGEDFEISSNCTMRVEK